VALEAAADTVSCHTAMKRIDWDFKTSAGTTRSIDAEYIAYYPTENVRAAGGCGCGALLVSWTCGVAL